MRASYLKMSCLQDSYFAAGIFFQIKSPKMDFIQMFNTTMPLNEVGAIEKMHK